MIQDSDILSNFEKISLIEKGNLLTDDFEISETFNKYFQNLVPNLDLKVPQYTNTRIIQVSKQSSKNGILAFLSKQCFLLT